MEKMYMHGKPIGKVFEWLGGPRMQGGKPAPQYGHQLPDDDDDDLDLDDEREEL